MMRLECLESECACRHAASPVCTQVGMCMLKCCGVQGDEGGGEQEERVYEEGLPGMQAQLEELRRQLKDKESQLQQLLPAIEPQQ